MWEKIKKTIFIVLAVLGVLFIIIMLLPDDEESDSPSDMQQTETVSDSSPDESDEAIIQGNSTETETQVENNETFGNGNVASVNIPESELSADTLKFKSLTLDNKEVTQDIFKDYDITIVHLWGTFCQPCIAEMGEYAKLYEDLPDNVNLIGIVSDVYDGIDNNVSKANEILDDAGAEFTNLRTSDDLYDVVDNFQYVPSSFFVDSEGHIIGEVLDGAGVEDTKERLDGYLK